LYETEVYLFTEPAQFNPHSHPIFLKTIFITSCLHPLFQTASSPDSNFMWNSYHALHVYWNLGVHSLVCWQSRRTSLPESTKSTNL